MSKVAEKFMKQGMLFSELYENPIKFEVSQQTSSAYGFLKMKTNTLTSQEDALDMGKASSKYSPGHCKIQRGHNLLSRRAVAIRQRLKRKLEARKWNKGKNF
tara:strand:+ start:40 stop:345 length:306 start_codon:yes stop_codon:yes gene_type:complete